MSLLQHVSSLDLPASQQQKCSENGFQAVNDILKDCEILPSLNIEELTRPPETKTALQCFEEEKSSKCVSCFLDNLEDVLDGVLRNGLITELVGLPGSGRTQLCLHLSVSAQVIEFGEFVETVYICTNMNFSISRLKEIAIMYKQSCSFFKNSTIDDILKRINYISIATIQELWDCMKLLEVFLEEHRYVTLVIIDSITYPLRQVEGSEKTACLYTLINKLRHLGNEYKFTVVLTNDMTTVTDSLNCVVPSLKESFYHIINNRIMLAKEDDMFCAELLKSSVKFPMKRYFKFTNFQVS